MLTIVHKKKALSDDSDRAIPYILAKFEVRYFFLGPRYCFSGGVEPTSVIARRGQRFTQR